LGFSKKIKKAVQAIARTTSMADEAQSLAMRQNTDITANQAPYNDGGTYSPGTPLIPQNTKQAPWTWQYRVGRNLVITPRMEEPSLVPFEVLKNIASAHDITGLCIQMMIDQVTGDEWDIVPDDKNDRENRTNEIQEAKDKWYKPDGVHLFNDWLKPILYDILSCDAGCIYKRKTYKGSLYALEYVDGTTIKPLIDSYGRVPEPPYAAFQQIIYGYPYGSSTKNVNTLGFTRDEISYRPRYPRTWTPYGMSPIEKILVKINIGLRRDTFQLDNFTDGSTPDGGIYSFDKPDITPDQIEQFSELYNDVMSGNLKERVKLKFLPKGTYTNTKNREIDIKIDEWIARIVAIAFGVNPQSFIMVMNRSTGQLQDQQQTDIGLTPLEMFLSEWFTDILQHDMGFKHLKFKYVDEKKEDAQLSIERDTQFVQMGIYTADEIRSRRGMPPLTNMKDGIPPYVKVGNDVIFLTEEYIKAKTEAQVKSLEVGNTQGGNQLDTTNKLKQLKEKTSSQGEAQDDNTSNKDKSIVGENKTSQKSTQSELRRFEKFSLKRLHKSSVRKFKSNILPYHMIKNISSQLKKADTEDDVKEIFSVMYKFAPDDDDLEMAFNDLREQMIANTDAIKSDDTRDKKKLLLLLLAGIDFSQFAPAVDTMLTGIAEEAAENAINDINKMGGSIKLSDISNDIDNIVSKRKEFLLQDIKTVTQDKIQSDISNADSPQDIRQAISDSYALSKDRTETIQDVENRYMENATRIAVGKQDNVVAGVLVSDGTEYDSPCVNANGQIWTLKYAEDHILEHPRCHRQFTYVTQDEVENNGGFDEK
jgi:hypothetical protein